MSEDTLKNEQLKRNTSVRESEWETERERDAVGRGESEREIGGLNDVAPTQPVVPVNPAAGPTSAPSMSKGSTGSAATATARARESEPHTPLFAPGDSQSLRARWEGLQVTFVDEPRRSVEEADRLVNETINSLTKNFAAERQKLEQQWHRGEEASTEDLRLALRRYRSFFERLLSV